MRGLGEAMVILGRHHHMLAPVGELFDLEFRGQPPGVMQTGSCGLVETVEASPHYQADSTPNHIDN